jgi:hypothetical protein
MTAIAAQPGLRETGPSPLTRTKWAVSDTLTISRRNLIVWYRVPAHLFSVVQPGTVLLFRYVFGGAIPAACSFCFRHRQTAAFASFGTAIALAQELQKGVIDRLRSMPMARSAVPPVADTVRCWGRFHIVPVYAVGFRFTNGFVPAIDMIILATVFGDLLHRGLYRPAIGDEESVQSFGLICCSR